MIDFGSKDMRKMIIAEIDSEENKRRKEESLQQFEILKDRCEPFVIEYLKKFYQEDSICELPIVSSINIGRRIIQQEAAVYDIAPERSFTGVSEEQSAKILKLYEEMGVNQKMLKANQFYKAEDQTHVQVTLSKGKLKIRNLMGHHLDAIPSDLDATEAEAYLVSGYDRSAYLPRLKSYQDLMDQKIADPDDYEESLKRIAVWTNELNFIMDKDGNVVSGDEVLNPLELMPFVDISVDKDSEYFVRSGHATSQFTIQFNGSVTDLAQIVRMQGFAQAWFKGSEEIMPQNLRIGPNIVLKLPINPERPAETDFGYATPNSDLSGSIEFLNTVLSSFLSSRGIDPKTINTRGESQTYSSGFERLLSLIEQFKPSKQDFAVFKKAEKQLFKIIKAYINTYSGTDLLQYDIGPIPEGADIEVKFFEPQSVLSENEKVDLLQKKIDLGLISKVEAIMYDRGLPEEEAEKVLEKIQKETMPKEEIVE